MTAAALSVLVPLRGGLRARRELRRSCAGARAGPPVAVGAAAAISLRSPLGAPTAAAGSSWFGGWGSRAAVGVAFVVDGLGAGLAVFVAVLASAALVVAARVIAVETPGSSTRCCSS